MSKGHRDNHTARVKRGPVAFQKKAERRAPQAKCARCGTLCRPQKLNDLAWCPICAGGYR